MTVKELLEALVDFDPKEQVAISTDDGYGNPEVSANVGVKHYYGVPLIYCKDKDNDS